MTGQQHGKQLEDVLKALLYPGAADTGRAPTARFDIEEEFDRKLGLPTSIKTAKVCKTIALADARGFWAITKPFRLTVLCWRQKDQTTKEFYAVHEFIIHGAMMDELRGGVTLSMIGEMHEGLGLAPFPKGQHFAARRWAQASKKALLALNPLITLNRNIEMHVENIIKQLLQPLRSTQFDLGNPPPLCWT